MGPDCKFVLSLQPVNTDRKYVVIFDSEEELEDWHGALNAQIARQVVEKLDSNSIKEGYVRPVSNVPAAVKVGYLMLSPQRLLLYRARPSTAVGLLASRYSPARLM